MDTTQNSTAHNDEKEELPAPSIEEIEEEWAVMACDSECEWI